MTDLRSKLAASGTLAVPRRAGAALPNDVSLKVFRFATTQDLGRLGRADHRAQRGRRDQNERGAARRERGDGHEAQRRDQRPAAERHGDARGRRRARGAWRFRRRGNLRDLDGRGAGARRDVLQTGNLVGERRAGRERASRAARDERTPRKAPARHFVSGRRRGNVPGTDGGRARRRRRARDARGGDVRSLRGRDAPHRTARDVTSCYVAKWGADEDEDALFLNQVFRVSRQNARMTRANPRIRPTVSQVWHFSDLSISRDWRNGRREKMLSSL